MLLGYKVWKLLTNYSCLNSSTFPRKKKKRKKKKAKIFYSHYIGTGVSAREKGEEEVSGIRT